jgi:hypothetical protein
MRATYDIRYEKTRTTQHSAHHGMAWHGMAWHGMQQTVNRQRTVVLVDPVDEKQRESRDEEDRRQPRREQQRNHHGLQAELVPHP